MYSFKDCPSIHYTKLQAFFESVKRGVDCRSLRNLNGRGFKLCNPINTTITKPHSFQFNARRKTLFKNLAVVQFFLHNAFCQKPFIIFTGGLHVGETFWSSCCMAILWTLTRISFSIQVVKVKFQLKIIEYKNIR